MARKISTFVCNAYWLPVSVKANLHGKLSAQRGRNYKVKEFFTE